VLPVATLAARSRERKESVTMGWMAPWVSRGFWPQTLDHPGSAGDRWSESVNPNYSVDLSGIA
jgi:hypothetical protein